MTLLYVVLVLLAVGVGLWLINTYASQIVDLKIIKIINVVVILVVVYWLLVVSGIWAWLSTIKMPGGGQ